MRQIYRFTTLDDLSTASAQTFEQLASASIKKSGRFSVALSGGNTPKRLFQLLTQQYRQKIDWSAVHIFWGDERCVSPESSESNYGMARTHLLNHVPLKPENIYRIQGELPPPEASEEYNDVLHGYFGDTPTFDLILLGMGDDGHTASLFPNTEALTKTDRWVTENYVPQVKNNWRITFTYSLINQANHVMILVAGSNKKERIEQALSDDPLKALPIQGVNPHNGTLIWMISESDL